MIRKRLIDTGAGDGTVKRFRSTYSIVCGDPDGLEGEVLVRRY
jgi:hypothetical protein